MSDVIFQCLLVWYHRTNKVNKKVTKQDFYDICELGTLKHDPSHFSMRKPADWAHPKSEVTPPSTKPPVTQPTPPPAETHPAPSYPEISPEATFYLFALFKS